ncbi:unnamed protein product [Meloidogyne enterolobii]|uniref:Uncharacterized protein n=1 Tax=Meloidogyne enterolobii TaxID=390850 RepID=A0ACB1A1B8_MELEN
MLNSTNSQDDTNINLLNNGEVSIRQRSFSSNNAPPVKMAASGAIKVKRKLTTLGPTKAKDTVNAAENTATTSSTVTTTTTNTDSDSGRPRSTMEELENMPDEVNEERPEGDGNENVDGEEDDYPEEPPELMALHQMEKRRRKKSSKGKNEGDIGEEEREGEEREGGEREEVMEKEEENEEGEREGLDTVGDEMENGREDAREDGMEEREEEALDEVAMNEDEDKDEDDEEDNEDEDEEVRRINKVEDMKEEDVEEVNEMDEVTTPPKIEEEAKSPSPVQYTIVHTGGSNPEQENEGGMSGVYSDELERILYGQAAVKIQSVWRGYTVRKGFKHTRFSEHPIYIGTGSYAPRRRSKNNLYKPNERHHAIITRVKTPKSGKRKTSFKKTSTTMLVPDYGNETAHDSSSDREEASVTELLQGKQRLGWEMSQDHIDKSPVNSQRTPRTDYLYTITVLTGNRWAADTEADLYIILVGAGGIESERLWLRQEFTNWLQSGANGQRFRQNHSDSFQFRVPSRFGILKKLTIGHDCKGYGAGIFIDRIMVTEDEEASEDCRQFLFLCNKWLDSGQVDGKLERTIRLSSFYEISSIPIEDRVTRGRWELILHGGSEKGLGGTTSQLSITGYGTRAQSTTSGLYDSNMAKVPSDALIQVKIALGGC